MAQSLVSTIFTFSFGILFAVLVLEQSRPAAAVARATARVRLDPDELTSRGSFEQVADRVAARFERNALALERSLRHLLRDHETASDDSPDAQSDLRFEPARGSGARRRLQKRVASASDALPGDRSEAREATRLELRESSSRAMLHQRVHQIVLLLQRALRSGACRVQFSTSEYASGIWL